MTPLWGETGDVIVISDSPVTDMTPLWGETGDVIVIDQ